MICINFILKFNNRHWLSKIRHAFLFVIDLVGFWFGFSFVCPIHFSFFYLFCNEEDMCVAGSFQIISMWQLIRLGREHWLIYVYYIDWMNEWINLLISLICALSTSNMLNLRIDCLNIVQLGRRFSFFAIVVSQ